jgi:nucleoid DNA-binding protein
MTDNQYPIAMITESLINLTAEETGQTQAQTKATLKAAFKIIRGTVASGEAVRLPDLGTFQARHISEGGERNPQAGDPVDDVRVVKFSPAEAFRKEVNHRS